MPRFYRKKKNHWIQVLVLSECGFPAWPVAALVSLSKTLNHNCFVLRMGRRAVGPVCCVMHVKTTQDTYREREGAWPRCFWIRALSTQQGGYVRATNLLYYYYYYFALAQHEKKDLVFFSAGYTSSQATSRRLRSRASFAESLLSLRVRPSVVILLSQMFLQRHRDCTQCSHYQRNNLHFDLLLIILGKIPSTIPDQRPEVYLSTRHAEPSSSG